MLLSPTSALAPACTPASAVSRSCTQLFAVNCEGLTRGKSRQNGVFRSKRSYLGGLGYERSLSLISPSIHVEIPVAARVTFDPSTAAMTAFGPESRGFGVRS